jgi:hypothetical protein
MLTGAVAHPGPHYRNGLGKSEPGSKRGAETWVMGVRLRPTRKPVYEPLTPKTKRAANLPDPLIAAEQWIFG